MFCCCEAKCLGGFTHGFKITQLATYCLLTQQLYPTPPFNGTILSNILLCFNGKHKHDEILS